MFAANFASWWFLRSRSQKAVLACTCLMGAIAMRRTGPCMMASKFNDKGGRKLSWKKPEGKSQILPKLIHSQNLK